MEVFIVMGVPQFMDGLFHGKSIYKWMRTGGTPILGNHHVMKNGDRLYFSPKTNGLILPKGFEIRSSSPNKHPQRGTLRCFCHDNSRKVVVTRCNKGPGTDLEVFGVISPGSTKAWELRSLTQTPSCWMQIFGSSLKWRFH